MGRLSCEVVESQSREQADDPLGILLLTSARDRFSLTSVLLAMYNPREGFCRTPLATWRRSWVREKPMDSRSRVRWIGLSLSMS